MSLWGAKGSMTTKEMHMKISSRGFIGSTAAFAGTAAAALDVPKGSAKKAPKGAAKLPLSRMPAFAVAMAAVLAAVAVPSAAERGFVVVTDYVKADGKADVSDAIQKVIDEHPNRTIFFPDGTYLLSKSVSTPAHPEKSVDLQLSRYAVLKAAPGWTSSEAMVRLGGIHAANIVWANGSVYSLSGGIIDCSGVANGVSIDSGRDTRVKGVVIRNAAVGLRIKNGANSGSSDCEISDLDITGNGATNSIGVLVEAYDTHIANIRITRAMVGVKLVKGGNMLTNIHALFSSHCQAQTAVYGESVGFLDVSWANRYRCCYSDHFSTSFHLNGPSILDACIAWWYGNAEFGRGKRRTAIKCPGKFLAHVTDLEIGFSGALAQNTVLEVGKDGGTGFLLHPIYNEGLVNDAKKVHLKHVVRLPLPGTSVPAK